MAPSENDQQSSIQQAADQFTRELIARRQKERDTRSAALDEHPNPISVTTQLTRAAHLSPTAAAMPAVATSETHRTAGYLLALGDSWFDYPIHDVLTKLDTNYGYNIESAAHAGDSLESIVSKVGQFAKFTPLPGQNSLRRSKAKSHPRLRWRR